MKEKLDERYFEKDLEYKFKNNISMYTKKSVKARVKLTIEELESCYTGLTCDYDFERGISTAVQLIKLNFDKKSHKKLSNN